MFRILGQGVARAILDERILDLPLSSLFYDLLLERVIIIWVADQSEPGQNNRQIIGRDSSEITGDHQSKGDHSKQQKINYGPEDRGLRKYYLRGRDIAFRGLKLKI